MIWIADIFFFTFATVFMQYNAKLLYSICEHLCATFFFCKQQFQVVMMHGALNYHNRFAKMMHCALTFHYRFAKFFLLGVCLVSIKEMENISTLLGYYFQGISHDGNLRSWL